MKEGYMMPSVIDFAYEIIGLHEENLKLRRDVEHLTTMNNILHESRESSTRHTNAMTGALLLHAIGADDAARDLLERS